MKLDLRIPTSFPSFDEWSVEKTNFMIRRAVADHVEEDDMEYQSDEGEKSVVVCTEAMSEENPMSECRYCRTRIKVVFSVDLDEWVYEGSRQTRGGTVLHSLCYYFVRRGRVML